MNYITELEFMVFLLEFFRIRESQIFNKRRLVVVDVPNSNGQEKLN